MFRIGEAEEENECTLCTNDAHRDQDSCEHLVFGTFDRDDPDFCTGAPKLRSRHPSSRNGSSTSLRRNASSTNSLGKFFIGTGGLSSNQSSCESLTIARDLMRIHSFCLSTQTGNVFDECEYTINMRGNNRLETCFTCGVQWNRQHYSLDCFECGGFALERVCPVCDGECNAIWQRDILTSHYLRTATWMGRCEGASSTSKSSSSSSSSLSSSSSFHEDLDVPLPSSPSNHVTPRRSDTSMINGPDSTSQEQINAHETIQ